MKAGLFSRLALVGALLVPFAAAHAETYKIGVSRKSSNLYKVEGKETMIHTRDCEFYGYAENALLITGDDGMELQINEPQEKHKCVVRSVYDVTKPKAGKYGVTITRIENDWFEVSGSHLYLKTAARCVLVAVTKAVTLEVDREIGGALLFPDGKRCKVEGIYARASS